MNFIVSLAKGVYIDMIIIVLGLIIALVALI